jgi:hypothetical protein
MAGKYNGLRNQLERKEDLSPYGEKVTKRKLELQSVKTQSELANVIKHLKNRKEVLEKIASKIEFETNAAEKALAEFLEAQGIESFKVASGGSLFLQDKIYPQVKDKAALRAWAVNNGLEKELGLHHKTVEGLCGDALLNGRPLPDGVDVFIDVRIGTRNLVEKSVGEA